MAGFRKDSKNRRKLFVRHPRPILRVEAKRQFRFDGSHVLFPSFSANLLPIYQTTENSPSRKDPLPQLQRLENVLQGKLNNARRHGVTRDLAEAGHRSIIYRLTKLRMVEGVEEFRPEH